MPLGAFLLRRSASSKSLASTTEKSSSPESESKSKKKKKSKSRGRSSSRGRKKSSRNRSTSRDSRASSVRSNTSTSSSRHALRSKSPSRARIEQFMNEIRAHEEAVARRRAREAEATNNRGANSSSPTSDNRNNNKQRKSTTTPVGKITNKRSSPSLKNNTKSTSPEQNGERSERVQRNESKERSLSREKQQLSSNARSLPSRSRSGSIERLSSAAQQQQQQKQQQGRLCASERGRAPTNQRDRSRSVSKERVRLELFLADRSGDGSNSNLSISEHGKLTIIAMDDDDSSSSEESSCASLSRFEERPLQPPITTLTGRAVSAGAATPKTISLRKNDNDRSRSPLSSSPSNGALQPRPNQWHTAIQNRDWDSIEKFLQTYDRKRYLQDGGSSPKKIQKKLRVLKYLPKGKSDTNPDTFKMDDDISPLLCVDAKGCTPLHLACKEFMPVKLLQKILFLERNAASVQDLDGRWPLHIAIIGNLSKPVLDKLIRADPAVLGRPDNMKKTPLAYAILRAEHSRDKILEFTWSTPTSEEQKAWQSHLTEGWATVTFLLETLVTRRQALSETYESPLLLQAVDFYAPPAVLQIMLPLASTILEQNQRLTIKIANNLVRKHYPASILRKLLKVCMSSSSTWTSSYPREQVTKVFRSAMLEQYKEGCVARVRNELGGREKSFRSELVSAYQSSGEATLTETCKEWWEKLRFCIAVGSGNLEDPRTLADEFTVHAALTIPETPSSLIDCLIRMFPQSRYVNDPATDALPLHLFCRYWGNSRLLMTRKSNPQQEEACRVLNLLLAGDFTLAWKRYKRRIPLHYAITSGKPLKFIRILISMDVKTANAKDLRADLFPFQLAALPRSCNGKPITGKDAELNQLDTIFELLKINPTAACPKLALGSGDPKGDVGPVARHVVNWCYSYKRGESDTGWFMDKKHVQVLRSTISRGAMPSSLKKWWGDLKRKIWNVYDRQNAGKTIAYMPRMDRFLLHAALYNGRTPPIVIELLLELYPDAAETKAPGTDRYPLHIAAGSPSYTPLPFENVISMSSALEMVLLSYPDALRETSEGRTVLQIAVDSGKTHEEIRPLFQHHPGMLTVPDKVSGLYPFQQIASVECSIPTHLLIRDKTSTIKWNERSTEENARLLRGFQVTYQRDKLSSIYEMLRAKPQVVANCFA